MRIILIGVLAVIAAGPGRAQEPAAAPAEVAVVQELAQIHASLREIAATLARQAEQSRLDLLIKRTQMALGELERSEAQLQALENERTNLEDQRARLAEQAEAMASRSEDVTAEQREALAAEIDGEQKRLAQRLRTLDGQIADLQNRTAARREELRGWQAVVDRSLTGL
jgi:chromosome segregation ATPase